MRDAIEDNSLMTGFFLIIRRKTCEKKSWLDTINIYKRYLTSSTVTITPLITSYSLFIGRRSPCRPR